MGTGTEPPWAPRRGHHGHHEHQDTATMCTGTRPPWVAGQGHYGHRDRATMGTMGTRTRAPRAPGQGHHRHQDKAAAGNTTRPPCPWGHSHHGQHVHRAVGTEGAGHSPAGAEDAEEGGVLPAGTGQREHGLQAVEVQLLLGRRAHQARLQERCPLLLQRPCAAHIPLCGHGDRDTA